MPSATLGQPLVAAPHGPLSTPARRWLLAAGLATGATLAAVLLIVAVVLIAVGVRSAVPYATYSPSAWALVDIPPAYLALYQSAGERYGLDWAVLAGIGSVESDHGRLRARGVTSGTNRAGAAGPMQFLPRTWARDGIDGNGDGRKDVYDPTDAIPAAANYLRASGAPADWPRALFAYNHAHWYVAEVLDRAERYRQAPPGMTGDAPAVRRVPFAGVWLARVSGTHLRCDARIVGDVLWILRRFDLRLTACFSAAGHARGGEHPLGLAIDAAPADGVWSHALAAAQAFGWSERCGRTGCAGELAPPIRFVGYNGFAGHGDPAHCGCGEGAHIHFSWNHAPAAPLTPAAWVEVIRELPLGAE